MVIGENLPPGYLSPAVRALIQLHAVDLAGIRGSGAQGRVALADILSVLASARAGLRRPTTGSGRQEHAGSRSKDQRARDEIVEVQVDVTGDERPAGEVRAAVRQALREVPGGEDAEPILVASLDGPTRVVPALAGSARVAVGVGAAHWAAVSIVTADGQRVLANRIARSIVVRSSTSARDVSSAALLSAVAAALSNRGVDHHE